MKNCTGCKYAKWDITKSGRLHPSGKGACQYKFKIPVLPECLFWLGGIAPEPYSCRINRKRTLNDNCAYYEKK